MNLIGIFEVAPYAALASCVVGLTVRYRVGWRAAQTTNNRAPSRFEVVAKRSWLAAVLALCAAHLAGLLIPRAFLLWNSVALRLYVLEASGLAIGFVVLLGCIVVVLRHLSRSHTSIGPAIGDSLFLSVALLSVVSGLLTAVLYRWGSNWSTVTLTPYVRSLAQGHPSAWLVLRLPFAVHLHLASAFAVVALFPVSSVAPWVLVALSNLLGRLAKPLAAGMRWGEAWAIRLNPAAWIWPEED